MRNTALGALVVAVLILAGCASPERPQVQAEAIPACEPYKGDPTAFARCRLFAGGQGSDLIPEAGRTASLHAQIRCAPLRTSPGHYKACVEGEQDPQLAAVAPAAGPLAAIASETRNSAEADYPSARLPDFVEHRASIVRAPVAPEPADSNEEFAELLKAVERLDRRSTEPQPDGAVARAAPDARGPAEVRPSSGEWVRLRLERSGAEGWMSGRYVARDRPGSDPAALRPQPAPSTSHPKQLVEPSAGSALSDDAIREALVRASIVTYSGNCPCPYNLDRAGRRCGGRSAYSRPGGASPYCYPSDVPAAAVAAHAQRLAAQ